ncbi:hypothetical protein BUALT_Bualt15G0102800 [Buddleja alternifolia]|uniref:Uncharacterized protein n=1 Tax=Buddleja alternifolia TaxID=168488 RepID=A0AAV6WKP4_9LAMI|nr:hypothetical protein BUALT_Bualt15G0102800 [Buddleja alternifolia]
MLEHIDEILRSARLSGYLFIRTVLWAALLGEPLPIDDAEVDDWLPRFIVLHGSCIYLYMIATGLRYECSSTSKMQVDSWLAALKIDCKLTSDSEDLNDPVKA